ncbi:MAG: DUF3592 domain-containing protein [Isosphaeraceae bacterium]
MSTGWFGFAAFVGIFYAIGLGVLGFGLWGAWRSTAAASWPTTRCQLKEAHLHTQSEGSEGGPTYEVTVRYTYAVDGVIYEGDRVAFGYRSSNNLSAHRGIHDALSRAKALSVRYDPVRPAVSCLSYGVHQSIQFMIVFGAVWLAFCIGFTCLCWISGASDDVLIRNLTVG